MLQRMFFKTRATMKENNGSQNLNSKGENGIKMLTGGFHHTFTQDDNLIE